VCITEDRRTYNIHKVDYYILIRNYSWRSQEEAKINKDISAKSPSVDHETLGGKTFSLMVNWEWSHSTVS